MVVVKKGDLTAEEAEIEKKRIEQGIVLKIGRIKENFRLSWNLVQYHRNLQNKSGFTVNAHESCIES